MEDSNISKNAIVCYSMKRNTIQELTQIDPSPSSYTP